MLALGVAAHSQTTYYALNEGSWSDYTRWTTDRSGLTYVNDAHAFPGAGDVAIIPGGRTMTLDAAVSIAQLTLNGSLEVAKSATLTAASADGEGSITLADYADMQIASNGLLQTGTVCLTGSCNVDGTQFRHLKVSGGEVTLSASAVHITGDLTLTDGASLSITRESASTAPNGSYLTSAISMTVDGNITVGSGCALQAKGSVCDGSAYGHSVLTVGGNFVNSGTVAFARPAPGQSATLDHAAMSRLEGIVEVRFEGSGEQTLQCNGPTTLFRMVCAKATEEQLFLTASASGNFKTMANVTDVERSFEELPIVLRSGILKLGENISIDAWGCNRLADGRPNASAKDASGNALSADDARAAQQNNGLYIPSGATLWIAGATVNPGSHAGADGQTYYGNVCLVGTLHISGGKLTLPDNSVGIYITDPDGTLADQPAQLIVDGGTITTDRIVCCKGRKLVYRQTAGTVSITKAQKQSGYPQWYISQALSMQNGGQFVMSGGTLMIATYGNLKANGTNGYNNDDWINGIDIRNVGTGSITGGTITIKNTQTDSGTRKLFVHAPGLEFYNLVIDAPTVANKPVVFLGGSKKTGLNNTISSSSASGNNENTTVVVKNNLTLNASANTILHTTRYLCVGRNLTVGADAELRNLSDSQKQVHLTMDGSQSARIDNYGTINVGNLTVSKTSATASVTIAQSLGFSGNLTITRGALVGSLRTSGSAAQTITVDSEGDATQLAMTTGVAQNLTLGSDVTLGSIDLATDGGLVQLGSYNLTLLAAPTCTGGSWGTGRMFVTDGDYAAKGLTLTLAQNGTTLFPVGTSGKYAPCSVTNTTASGRLTVTPCDGVHPVLSGLIKDIKMALEYYWRTKLDGTGDANLTFVFTSPIDLKSSLFFGLAYPYSYIANEWAKYSSGVDKSAKTLTYKNLTNCSGDFTETSSVILVNIEATVTYYSLTSGEWASGKTWTTNSEGGAEAGSYPGAKDVAIVKEGHTVTVAANSATAAGLTINEGGKVVVKAGTAGHSVASVSGDGDLIYELSANAGNTWLTSGNFLGGDHGEFCNSSKARWIYRNVRDKYSMVTLPSQVNLYPNLYTDGLCKLDKTTATVNGNLVITKESATSSTGRLEIVGGSSIDIKGDLLVEASRTITTKNGSSVTVRGSIGNDGTANVASNLTVYGHIVNNGTFKVYKDGGNGNLIFAGNEASTISGNVITFTSSSITSCSRLTINKEQASLLVDFEAPVESSGVDYVMTDLQRGTLRFSNSATDIGLLSNTSDASATYLEIPATASLQATGGSTLRFVGSHKASVKLGGTLSVTGSTAAATNGIGYTESGSSKLLVNNGATLSASYLAPFDGSGTLTFRQQNKNSTVTFGTDGLTDPNCGILDVRAGEFKQVAGAVVNIIKSTTNPQTVPAFRFMATGPSLAAGSKFVLDTKAPTAIYTNNELQAMDIASGTEAFVQGYGLVFNSKLTVDGQLDSKGFDISLKGNADFNGTYVPTGNTTTICGSAEQTIGGTAAKVEFANLAKTTSAQKAVLSVPASVAGNLTIDKGELQTGSLTDVAGTVSIGTDCKLTGAGIRMNNADAAQLLRCEGSITTLNIDNANGVDASTQQSYPIMITDGLVMTNGQFNIGGNSLELTAAASIANGNDVPFGTDKMIVTNLSLTDRGIKKDVTAGLAVDMLMPFGCSGKYTPATIKATVQSTTASAYIRIAPADELFVSMPAASADHVLNYYWSVTSEGITGLNGSIRFDGLLSDAKGYNDNYETAMLPEASDTWKINSGKVSVADDRIILDFDQSGATSGSITGDYMAGDRDHLPEKVTTYISLANGNWAGSPIWKVYDPQTKQAIGDLLTLTDAQLNGSILYIGSQVALDSDEKRVCAVNINADGVLTIGSTINHRFGYLKGTGRLVVQNGSLPSANYESFFGRNGGTIEFTGTTDYNIMSYSTFVNNVIFSGSGRRIFRSDDVTVDIYGNFVVNGQSDLKVETAKDRTVRLYGNMELLKGDLSGNGIYEFCGSARQTVTGRDLTAHSLTVNNPSGVTSEYNISLDGVLTLKDGVIALEGNKTLTVSNSASTAVTSTGSSSFVDGMLVRNVTASTNVLYPVGSGSRYGYAYVSPQTGGYWGVAYVSSSPSTSANDQMTISDNEYWKLYNADGKSAKLTVRWDVQSNVDAWDSEFSLATREWSDGGYVWDKLASSTSSRKGDSQNGSIQTADYVTGLVNNEPRFVSFGLVSVPEYTWVGATSDDWYTLSNWKGNSLPQSSSEVVIGDGSAYYPVIGKSGDVAKAHSITMRGSSATLTLGPGGRLTVYGDMFIENKGQFVINQHSSSMPSFICNGSMVYFGDKTKAYDGVLVNRTFATARLWYVGSAIKGSGIYDASALNNVNVSGGDALSYFDTQKDVYVYEPNFGPDQCGGTLGLTKQFNGTDYAERTISQMGELQSRTTVTRTLHLKNGGSYGWNLLTNPYPFSLDLKSNVFSYTKDKVNPVIWFRSKNGAGYYFSTYSLETKVGVNMNLTDGGTSTAESVYSLAPHQAFFVKTVAEGSTFTFDPSTSSHIQDVTLKSTADDESDVLRLVISSAEANADETALIFREGGTFESNSVDAGKRMESDKFNQIYTLKGSAEYAIAAMPQTSAIGENVLPIGVKVSSKSSAAVIRATNIDTFDPSVDVYLYDFETGDVVSLRSQPRYEFEMASGTSISRFGIGLQPSQSQTEGGATGVAEQRRGAISISGDGREASVVIADDLLANDAQISVFDISGRLIRQVRTRNAVSRLTLGPAGVYMVRVKAGAEVRQERVCSHGI